MSAAGTAGLRQAAVDRYGLDPSHRDERFTDVVAFIMRLCDVPMASVSILDDEQQWYLAERGDLPDPLPRAETFCDHAIRSDALLEVRDTAADPRVSHLPMVTGDPHIRFYAGMPIVTAEGERLGAVCALDTACRPAGLSVVQREGLAMMAKLVMARLDDRRLVDERERSDRVAERALAASEERFRTLSDAMPQMVWSARPDGFVDYYNARWYAFTGLSAGASDGDGWDEILHPDDRERTVSAWQRSLASGEPYEAEYRLRHVEGGYRWTLGRALPLRSDAGAITRWFGTSTDIHEHKLVMDEREVISQELSHRIKNIFAVISGLVSLAARAHPTFAAAGADLRERITTLGRAHDFVRPHSPAASPSGGGQDSLHALLNELFRPYQDEAATRVVVYGDDLAIDDRAATPIALLFHELATNAAKYGALSAAAGRVSIRIDRDDDVTALTWSERGGPPIVASVEQRGFGSELIELSAVRQLGGKIERDWRPEGLFAAISIPNASFKR